MAFDMVACTPRIVRDKLVESNVGSNIVDRIVFMARMYNSPAYSAHVSYDDVSKRSFAQQSTTYVGLVQDFAVHLRYLNSCSR